MSILSAILQGILQGLTEFLPVSSSGHLSLYQYFTGINSESSVTFSVMLHLGTLLAVIIAFWPTVWQLLKEFFLLFADLFRGRLFKQPATPYRRMLYLLILSCVPLLLVLPLRGEVPALEEDVRELRRVRSSLPGAQIVIADCGLTAEARGLADYLAEREDNAAVVDGADFRLDAGHER